MSHQVCTGAVDGSPPVTRSPRGFRLDKATAIAAAAAAWLAHRADDFDAVVAAPLPGRRRVDAALCFFATLALYASVAPDALLNGDAALYLQQIEHRAFNHTTIHLGYYWLGWLFTQATPLDGERALNVLNGVLGAAAVALVFVITFRMGRNAVGAFVAAILLAVHDVFAVNATYAEVYVPQTALLLAAVWCWFDRRVVSAALCFGFACLVTPSSVLAWPLFAATRPRLRPLTWFSGVSAALVLAVLVPHVQDYLFGGRGVLNAAGLSLGWRGIARKDVRELVDGFFVGLPLVAIGLGLVLRDRRLRPFGIGLLVWFALNLVAERAEDVPVQLPVHAVLAIAGGLAGGWLTRALEPGSGRHVPHATLAALTAISFLLGINSARTLQVLQQLASETTAFRRTAEHIARVSGPQTLVVGDFGPGVLFEHYAERRFLTGRWIDTEWLAGSTPWARTFQQRATRRWSEAVGAGDEIWLLEREPGLVTELESAGYTVREYESAFRASRGRP